MQRKSKIAPINVSLSLKYIPTTVGEFTCPHCKELDWDYFDECDLNKQLLTCCHHCNKDFHINVPLKIIHGNKSTNRS